MRMISHWLALASALLATGSVAAPEPGPLAPLFGTGLGETRAALMIRDGHVVEKRYAPGYSDTTRFISWSMAKTVTALLVGELVADGKLALDAPAPIAEWHGANDPRRAITLRMLLNMSSGLGHTEIGDPVEASDTNQVLFVSGTQAMARRAIGAKLEARPGAKFEYSSLTTIILAEIVTRTLTASQDPTVRARTYQAFAERRLFAPAGITSARLEFDSAGTQIGGSLIYMTLADYGRLGTVLLDGKAPDGTQIVTPDWLAFMKTPSPDNREYGGQLWLNRPGAADPRPALFPGHGPATLVSCLGHLGQFVIASTEQRLVLVRLGKTQDDTPAFTHLRTTLGQIVERVPSADRVPPRR
ncbi:serine hydrolase [Sphingomonas sp. RB3P16]|uniref:serine hydrolase domain-containing protein n=1 Tax=Parasphingomonas frigoris TaxID=3096163 RepID=UPI002FC634E7